MTKQEFKARMKEARKVMSTDNYGCCWALMCGFEHYKSRKIKVLFYDCFYWLFQDGVFDSTYWLSEMYTPCTDDLNRQRRIKALKDFEYIMITSEVYKEL